MYKLSHSYEMWKTPVSVFAFRLMNLVHRPVYRYIAILFAMINTNIVDDCTN